MTTRGRPPKEVIGDPMHPYTRLLIDAIPWPDVDRSWGSVEDAKRSEEELTRDLGETGAVFRGDVPGFALVLH